MKRKRTSYTEHSENTVSFKNASYAKMVKEQGIKLAKKRCVGVLVDGRLFRSYKTAGDFMNTTGGVIKNNLERGVKEFRGYKIALYKDDK